MAKVAVFLGLGFLLLVDACSHQKTLDKQDLLSEVTSAESLAAESQMFVEYALQHRATKHFAKGHVEYLAEEAMRSAKELQQDLPPQGQDETLKKLRGQLQALSAELRTISGALEDDGALATGKKHIATIPQALHEVKSSL